LVNLGYHADGKLDFFFSLTSAIALHLWSVFRREWVQISAGNDYIDFSWFFSSPPNKCWNNAARELPSSQHCACSFWNPIHPFDDTQQYCEL